MNLDHVAVPRRHVLKLGLAAGAGWMLKAGLPVTAGEGGRRIFLGACDWSIGKSGTPESFAVAKALGLNGVQVSFGKPGGAHDLRQAEVRDAYRAAVRDSGLAMASLAMGILNSVPYATSPEAEQWVSDCVDTMKTLREESEALEDKDLAARVRPDRVLLAFFGKGDIKGNEEAMRSVAGRLKLLAPRAEKAGVLLGIESWMSADDHLRIIDDVGSPNVQVYYDVANSTTQGYDIYEEIARLGRHRICQIHAKENGFLLGQGKVDFPRLKKVLDGIEYDGWLVIESAQPKGLSLEEAYTHNRAYLASVFQGA